MHELSITENILNIAIKEAEKHGAKRIDKIRLRIGELTQVVPDCVQFYMDLLSKDTIAAGAKLEVESVPLSAKCRSCGMVSHPDGLNFFCEQCGGPPEIISGRELYIDSIEVE